MSRCVSPVNAALHSMSHLRSLDAELHREMRLTWAGPRCDVLNAHIHTISSPCAMYTPHVQRARELMRTHGQASQAGCCLHRLHAGRRRR